MAEGPELEAPELGMTASIVIPACNEAVVIGRTLRTLLDGAAPGEFEVIVVANGCIDDTAALARAAHPDVQVVETPIGSKPHALNLGDQAAHAFPRFYIDADVEISPESIRRVSAQLTSGTVQAAAPRMRIDLSGRPWAVRADHAVWLRMPYMQTGQFGGVYGLSEAGRARFDAFPDLVADDMFVRDLFAPTERVTLSDCEFTVQAPHTLKNLIRVRARVHAGNRQYRVRHPNHFSSVDTTTSRRRELGRLLREPQWWPRVAMYTINYALAQALAWWKVRTGRVAVWARDEATR